MVHKTKATIRPERERERKRDRERQRQRDRERDRETETERETVRDRERINCRQTMLKKLSVHPEWIASQSTTAYRGNS